MPETLTNIISKVFADVRTGDKLFLRRIWSVSNTLTMSRTTFRRKNSSATQYMWSLGCNGLHGTSMKPPGSLNLVLCESQMRNVGMGVFVWTELGPIKQAFELVKILPKHKGTDKCRTPPCGKLAPSPDGSHL